MEITYKQILLTYLSENNFFYIEKSSEDDCLFRLVFRFPFVPELDLMTSSLPECQVEMINLNKKILQFINSF